MIRSRRNQRGIALLLVLTVVVAASILGMTYLSVASVQLACSSNLVHASEATYLAESGVQHGLWILRTTPETFTSASQANPLGPFRLDSEDGQYTIYGAETGDPLQYEVTATATSGGVTRTVRAIARLYSRYEDTIVSMGPVHLWRLGESDGGKAHDDAGDKDGDYKNEPELGQPGALCGDLDTAVHFDGINDYVDLHELDLYGDQMTILCWFKADDFNLDDYRFISKANGIQADDHYWMLGTVNYGGYPVLRMRIRTPFTTSTINASSGVLEPGVWTMASATYDGLFVRLYKDADEVGLGLKMGEVSRDSQVRTWIGGNPDGDTSRPFHGTIDEVAIFSRALSASEINMLYKARQASVEVVKWEK